MSKAKPKPRLSKTNTRKHWALYAMDAWESENGRDEGATADDIWKLVGDEESVVFTSRKDTAAGLRACHDDGFCQRRSIEGEWSEPVLIAYRLNQKGATALKDAGRPTKKPNRHRDGYERDLPSPPTHEIQGTVLGSDPEEDADEDWLRTEDPDGWVETSHDNLYYRSDGDAFDGMGGGVEGAASKVSEAFHDGWAIVVTRGPYRMRDVGYRLDTETKRIHLDYYSVRPGTQYTEAVIRSITRDLKRIEE